MPVDDATQSELSNCQPVLKARLEVVFKIAMLAVMSVGSSN